MKHLSLLFLITLICFLTACETTFTEKKSESFSIELPDFLSEATDLNENATLQYSNGAMEFYLVVIEYPKSEIDQVYTLDKLYTFLSDEITSGIQGGKGSKGKSIKTNGLKGERGNMTGELENEGKTYRLFYLMDVLEGKDKFYQVVTWTLETRKDSYHKNMLKIHNSFKEI